MSNIITPQSHRPLLLFSPSRRVVVVRALAVMILAVTSFSRVNAADLTGLWQAHLELGDAPLTLILEVSDGLATVVRLTGPHGSVSAAVASVPLESASVSALTSRVSSVSPTASGGVSAAGASCCAKAGSAITKLKSRVATRGI